MSDDMFIGLVIGWIVGWGCCLVVSALPSGYDSDGEGQGRK